MFFYILRFVKSELINMTQVWDKVPDSNRTHDLPSYQCSLFTYIFELIVIIVGYSINYFSFILAHGPISL